MSLLTKYDFKSLFSRKFIRSLYGCFLYHQLTGETPEVGVSYLYIMLVQYVEYIKKDVCQF